MNDEIEVILNDHIPLGDGNVPVAFMRYEGESETYITYNSMGDLPGLSGDNTTLGSVIRYDIHIFSKTNYANIEAAVKALLAAAGWTWKGSEPDLYEDDTGYYHKVNTFEKERSY